MIETQVLSATESAVTNSILIIRPSRPGDVPALREIFFGAYGESYPYPPTEQTVNPARGYFLTAEIGGVVVGCAGGCGYGDEDYHWTEWGRFVVMKDPRYRGQGFGKALNHARKARLRSGEVVMSETVCNNTRNQFMLGKLGFHPMGIMPLRYPGILTDQLGNQAESVLANFFWNSDGILFGGFGSRHLFLPDDWIQAVTLLLPEDRVRQALYAVNGVTHQDVRRHEAFRDPVQHFPGCEMVDIVVNHPSAIEAIACFRAEGFHLAALMPGIADNTVGVADRVRLYRVPDGTHIDWNLIQVVPQLAAFKDWMSVQT